MILIVWSSRFTIIMFCTALFVLSLGTKPFVFAQTNDTDAEKYSLNS